ncbi:MAG: alpha-ketoacid dehydrogenase subunit beta, partial [Planctomycetota bacterium]
LPCGGTQGAGPFHSQLPDLWTTHHPGLVVVAPSTPADAYHQMRLAIAHDDPVIMCEHKHLYFHAKGSVPAAPDLPLGRAAVRRAGSDCTVVAWGALQHDALEAAEALQREAGIDIEVVDPRCIKPLDVETLLASLARTGHLLVVSEDFPFGAVAAEICAQAADAGFTLLDAPPRRLTGRETPIPYHPDLWRAHKPQVADIVRAVRDLVRF